MLRSPRSKFCLSTHKEAFQRLVQSEAFEEASIASMLELQAEQNADPSPNQAADAYNRLLGAKRYLEILCSIWKPDEPTTKPKERTLNYEAGV